MRRIHLLSGDRTSVIDVRRLRSDRFAMDPRASEVDKLTIDPTRWLEGATLSSATSDNAAIALVTAAGIVTATYTAPGGWQSNRLTFTASDGRVRNIDIVTEPDPSDYWPVFDYGWMGV